MGRFPILAGLQELDEQALIRILKEPKNALTRQYQVLFAQSGATLDFTNAGLEKVARLALETETGVRGLRSVLERVLLPAMYELPCSVATHCVLNCDPEGHLVLERSNDARIIPEELAAAMG